MASYAIHVNGAVHTVDSRDPAQPLLYVLRNALALGGPKFGCGLGQCGACTVMADGAPIRSCQLPIADAQNMAIVTIEGLGTLEKPHPVQAAFITEQAAQCGYCTNGMVMTSAALIAQNPKPSLEEVKQALAGNLCRCGTHDRVLAAVMRATGRART
jgi:nicotinate dehydrogenase subunit A